MPPIKRSREAEKFQAALAQKKARTAPRTTTIPREVFALVVKYLHQAPRTLLRLSVVCRDTRDIILRESSDVWFDMLKTYQNNYFQTSMPLRLHHCSAIVRGIPMRPYPNFKDVEGRVMDTRYPPVVWQIRRSSWPFVGGVISADNPLSPAEVDTFAQHMIQVYRLSFSPCCGICRSKFKLQSVWGLGMRVCNSCFKDNLVSGAVLFHEYGINFNNLVPKLAGKVYCFHSTFKPRAMSQFLSYNPIDFEAANAQSLVFFWKPHLAKVVDLEAAKRELRDPDRISAAKKLTSSVQAFFTRVHMNQKGKYCWLSSHRYYLNAPAWPKRHQPDSPHNVRDLTESDRLMLSTCLHSLLRRANSDHDVQARTILQQRFLGYRGPYTLPTLRNPALVLERLRAYEAMRRENLVKHTPPHVKNTSYALKRWFDLPPSLAAAD